jgi:hypothetical protein
LTAEAAGPHLGSRLHPNAPHTMPWIFEYFWFVCAAFMLINVLVLRRRLATTVARGNATAAETERFVRWAGACLIGGPLTLGVIGLAAGWPSPFCAGVLSFGDVPRSLVSLVTLAGWVLLLWWVWRGDGAAFLSRVGPALSQRPDYDKSYPPHLVRLAVTAMVLVSGVGAIVVSRRMPLPPELGCRVAPSSDSRSLEPRHPLAKRAEHFLAAANATHAPALSP